MTRQRHLHLEKGTIKIGQWSVGSSLTSFPMMYMYLNALGLLGFNFNIASSKQTFKA
jgi:hypothetical protein